MRFAWDERKRQSNLRAHDLDFRDAATVFGGVTYTMEGDRLSYHEQLLMTLGFLGGLAVSLIHTESPSLIRVISFRKATHHEEAIHFQRFKD